MDQNSGVDSDVRYDGAQLDQKVLHKTNNANNHYGGDKNVNTNIYKM